MHVVAWVDEGGTCGVNERSAARIVALVFGNGARHDHEQAGTGVRMPPGMTSRLKRYADDYEVRFSLRVDPCLPLARLCRDVELLEGARTKDLRRHTHRGRCKGRHDYPQNITLAKLRLRREWDSLRSNPRFQKILAEPEPKTVY